MTEPDQTGARRKTLRVGRLQVEPGVKKPNVEKCGEKTHGNEIIAHKKSVFSDE